MKKEELRPCQIKREKKVAGWVGVRPTELVDGWFHRWYDERYTQDDSGHPASNLYALVELGDGTMEYHSPHDIRFLDRT